MENTKFIEIKKYKGYRKIGNDLDYIVIINHEEKTVILQFEESTTKTDWKNNFSFLPARLKIGKSYIWTTHGYKRAYDDSPVSEFERSCINYPDYKRIIRGWSFGSAMAKIAAVQFTQSGASLDELTTFGDVKCFLNPFIKLKNIKRIRQYVTPNDFVTWCVPFYHRTNKCTVGDKFSFKKIFKTEYYHTNYDKYDYSDFE